MRFSGVSALAIWNNAVRTLTGFGVGALIFPNNVNSSLAANSSVQFLTSANQCLIAAIMAKADASGSVTINMTDGVNTWIMQTVAAGTTGGQDTTFSLQSVFATVTNNSATVAAHYSAAGLRFIQ